MTDWKAFKLNAEDTFKKEHAKELNNVHMDGVTGFPVKFDLGLSPVLNNLASARKNNKPADIQKYITKGKEILGKYQTRIDGKKKELGGAYAILNTGLTTVTNTLK